MEKKNEERKSRWVKDTADYLTEKFVERIKTSIEKELQPRIYDLLEEEKDKIEKERADLDEVEQEVETEVKVVKYLEEVSDNIVKMFFDNIKKNKGGKK